MILHSCNDQLQVLYVCMLTWRGELPRLAESQLRAADDERHAPVTHHAIRQEATDEETILLTSSDDKPFVL